MSINETIDTDRDGNPLTYSDVVSVDDDIADSIDMKMKYSKAIDYINNRLDERERKIMIYRYGLDGKEPLTQREVAEKMGISRSYVSRIEKNTLHKMRVFIEGGTLSY